MKKSLLLIVALCISVGLFAQQEVNTGKVTERTLHSNMVKAIDEVGDFTIVDSDGITWNLYDQLALGKTIFLDLFFST